MMFMNSYDFVLCGDSLDLLLNISCDVVSDLIGSAYFIVLLKTSIIRLDGNPKIIIKTSSYYYSYC